MKVLISADTYYPHVNGASYFAQRLAEYLQKRGNEVAVICPGESFFHTKKTINNILVYGARSIPVVVYRDFRFSFYVEDGFVQKIIDEFKPDIVHIQAHFVVGRKVMKVARKNGLPVVATNHFMPENLIHYLPVPGFVRRFVGEVMWLDFVRVFSRADRITTPTESAAELIRLRFKKKIEVISCGIDLERFKPGPTQASLAAKYKFNFYQHPIGLYVGRLDKEKNLDFVLSAIALALKKVNFQFVIAGKGAEINNLKVICHNLSIAGYISFPGFIPDNDLPAPLVTLQG
ncbi:MAG: glycosyltransferase [Candidatus Vogelbacteria bacterium]|nr:glycosyltransferase [Candidatus Vogelbacteria bacterium]